VITKFFFHIEFVSTIIRIAGEETLSPPTIKGEVSMQVERTQSDALVENRLPDGSRVIVDSSSDTVFALNATSGAAWDACGRPTTLSRVAEEMQRSCGPDITEAIAEEAILQLQEKNLVKASGIISGVNRRKFITTLSAAALPLIVSLPIAEQRAHAKDAVSKTKKKEKVKGD
jgi:hypothetical protein